MDPPGVSNLVRESSENGDFRQPGSNGQQRELVPPPAVHEHEHLNHSYHQDALYENPCVGDAYIPFTPDFQKGSNPQSWSEGGIYTGQNCSLNTRQGQGSNSNTTGELPSTPEKSLASTFYGPQRPSHLASEDPQHFPFNPFIHTTPDNSNWPTRATNGWEEAPEEPYLPICHYGHLGVGYLTLGNGNSTVGVGGCGVQVVDSPQNSTSHRRYRKAFSERRRIEVQGVRAVGACIRCQYLRMVVSTTNCDYGNSWN